MITIKDIAKKAEVSVAAVSYALNNKPGVNEETKKKIKDIAEEMGYIPNSMAQGLQTKKTNIIGLIVPDISGAYISNLLKCLDFYASINNYFLLLGTSVRRPEMEYDIFDRFISKGVDGFIIVPGENDKVSYEKVIEKISTRHIPYLFATMHFPEIKSNYVVPDLEEGEYLITKYLVEKGFTDMVFVGGKRHNYFTEIRYKGFLRALKEANIKTDESKVIDYCPNYAFVEGYEAVGRYLDKYKLPEVFVSVNDSIAYGMIKGFKERGISVPNDVSIVGFDDIYLPTVDTVPLTTVKIPLEEMAEMCIDVLKESKGNKVLKQIILKPELKIRQSVGVKEKFML